MSNPSLLATGPKRKPLENREPERVNEAGTAHSENGYLPNRAGSTQQVEMNARDRDGNLDPTPILLDLHRITHDSSPVSYDKSEQRYQAKPGVTPMDLRAMLSSYDQYLAVANEEHITDIMDGLWGHYSFSATPPTGQKNVARDWMLKLSGKPLGPVYLAYDAMITKKRSGRVRLCDFLEELESQTRYFNQRRNAIENCLTGRSN